MRCYGAGGWLAYGTRLVRTQEPAVAGDVSGQNCSQSPIELGVSHLVADATQSAGIAGPCEVLLDSRR